jgi:anti-sigma factor RsiW
MRCDRAQELVDPLVDGELGDDDREAITAHMKDCPRCATLSVDIGRLGKSIAEVGREPAPKALVFRVRRHLANAVEHHEVGQKRFAPWRLPSGIMRQCATLAASCALSVLLTWSFMTSTGQVGRLEQEVLSAHVRSLLQDGPPIQVASSDTHRVKPWFAGRIDFAPDVKDLTTQGFPLLGGRLDYIRERRVVALVYRRQLHIVNVFMWPASGTEDALPKLATDNGYNLLVWNKSGVTYWVLSDLDARELSRLQSLL